MHCYLNTSGFLVLIQENVPFRTCLYGDHLALRTVANEVRSNDVGAVVGAAPQALNLAGQTHGVAAVNDPRTVLSHGHVEDCIAVAFPGHRDSVSTTFPHSCYVLRGARG